VDMVSASIILQSFLDNRKLMQNESE
jgi:RNase H-fold protein (predicted Holliday junction resolvase)